MTITDHSSQHYVIFHVNNQAFALPLKQVSRAVRMVALTLVPEAAPWIAGIIKIAGRVTPVVDLRKRLGFESKAVDPADRLLILNIQSRDLALIVDQVSEVLETTTVPLVSSADPLNQANAHLLTGVIHHAETLILVLDAGRLL